MEALIEIEHGDSSGGLYDVQGKRSCEPIIEEPAGAGHALIGVSCDSASVGPGGTVSGPDGCRSGCSVLFPACSGRLHCCTISLQMPCSETDVERVTSALPWAVLGSYDVRTSFAAWSPNDHFATFRRTSRSRSGGR